MAGHERELNWDIVGYLLTQFIFFFCNPDCATVFDQSNGQGRSKNVQVGETNIEVLLQDGWNDAVSAVRVNVGCIFTGYAHGNFDDEILALNGAGKTLKLPRGKDNALSSWTCQCSGKICLKIFSSLF